MATSSSNSLRIISNDSNSNSTESLYDESQTGTIETTSNRFSAKILDGKEVLQGKISQLLGRVSDYISQKASDFKLDGRNHPDENHIQKIQDIKPLEIPDGTKLGKKILKKFANAHIWGLQTGDKIAAAVGEIAYAVIFSPLDFVLPGKIGTIAATSIAIVVGLAARYAIFLISQLPQLILATPLLVGAGIITAVVSSGAAAITGLGLGSAPFWVAAFVVHRLLKKEIVQLGDQIVQLKEQNDQLKQLNHRMSTTLEQVATQVGVVIDVQPGERDPE